MNQQSRTFDGIDNEEYVGKIMKDGVVVGRIDIGSDGKAMVFVGESGDQRVRFASGVEAMYSDDDAQEMVNALFTVPQPSNGISNAVRAKVNESINEFTRLLEKETSYSNDLQKPYRIEHYQKQIERLNRILAGEIGMNDEMIVAPASELWGKTRQIIDAEKEQSTSKKYLYGMAYRPFQLGAQPKGQTAIYSDRTGDGYRHGIIEYDRKLTKEEVENFELLTFVDDAEMATLADYVSSVMGKYAKGYVEYGAEADEFKSRVDAAKKELYKYGVQCLECSKYGSDAAFYEDVYARLKAMVEEEVQPEPDDKLDRDTADSIGETIVAQLGGNQFVTMTGAKDFLNLTDGNGGLRFSLPNNFAKYKDKTVNKVFIRLNVMDTYDLEFGFARGTNYQIIATAEGIYNDNLREVFTRYTGLDTSLGGGRKPGKTQDEKQAYKDGVDARMAGKRSTALPMGYPTEAEANAWMDGWNATNNDPNNNKPTFKDDAPLPPPVTPTVDPAKAADIAYLNSVVDGTLEKIVSTAVGNKIMAIYVAREKEEDMAALLNDAMTAYTNATVAAAKARA